MCGITLILTLDNDQDQNNNAILLLINSLEQLQNRGYDSVGIGYFDLSKNLYNQEINNQNCNINIIKYASTATSDCFNDLKYYYKNYYKNYYENYYENNNNILNPRCAIGHTRWATHGPRNTINAHPHQSYDKQFILVHNGIIENFIELREFLREKNILSISETDSEVIVNLIAYYYEFTQNCEMAIVKACSKLQGTYALGILCKNLENCIYIIRNGSPLIFGKNDKMMICTSELSGFNDLVTN